MTAAQHGAFDVPTMGTVSNVGLMAQKAEEYGSHDKTFEIAVGRHGARASMASAQTLFEHAVEEGDIWRMCQTKDLPIRDWVRLTVNRAGRQGTPRSSGSMRTAPTTATSSPGPSGI